jgi:2-amino-4-hydroxy-6-hydroxymethyldihydropteridine diphosphokinase
MACNNAPGNSVNSEISVNNSPNNIEEKNYRVYLGLGSNLGERAENLQSGLAELTAAGVKICRESAIYLTKPWGGVEQPDFYNQVVAAETRLAPEELLRLVKGIEVAVGRRPTVFWGPRVLDIDILLYEELTFCSESLTIPHREMKNRAFVLAPLLEIAPKVEIPGMGLAADLYAALPEDEKNGVSRM